MSNKQNDQFNETATEAAFEAREEIPWHRKLHEFKWNALKGVLCHCGLSKDNPIHTSTPNQDRPSTRAGGPVVRVLVVKDGNFYQCQETERGWKCGVCRFGLIDVWARRDGWSEKCRRCGAELSSTYYGRGYFDLKVYNP